MARNKEAPEAFDFVALLDSIGEGSMRAKVDSLLAELTQAVRETGKAGKLSLTITMKPDGDFAGVAADAKITKPTHSVPPSVFFWSGESGLSRSNPRQLKMKDLGAGQVTEARDASEIEPGKPMRVI